MKIQKSILTNSVRRSLLMVSVTCSMTFAACLGVASTAGTHPTVNLQRAVVGEPQIGDNVTIGPSIYNSRDKSFDRPWPFGPEFNPQ